MCRESGRALRQPPAPPATRRRSPCPSGRLLARPVRSAGASEPGAVRTSTRPADARSLEQAEERLERPGPVPDRVQGGGLAHEGPGPPPPGARFEPTPVSGRPGRQRWYFVASRRRATSSSPEDPPPTRAVAFHVRPPMRSPAFRSCRRFSPSPSDRLPRARARHPASTPNRSRSCAGSPFGAPSWSGAVLVGHACPCRGPYECHAIPRRSRNPSGTLGRPSARGGAWGNHQHGHRDPQPEVP